MTSDSSRQRTEAEELAAARHEAQGARDELARIYDRLNEWKILYTRQSRHMSTLAHSFSTARKEAATAQRRLQAEQTKVSELETKLALCKAELALAYQSLNYTNDNAAPTSPSADQLGPDRTADPLLQAKS